MSNAIKSKTIYKLLKFNGSKNTLEYMGETIKQFKVLSHLDIFQIETTLNRLKNQLVSHEKKYMREATNHKLIKHDNGAVTLEFDLRGTDCVARKFELNFCDFGSHNSITMI